MDARRTIGVGIVVALCLTGCATDPEASISPVAGDGITMRSNSFLATVFRSEVVPQIKQRMTTEEIFALFGEHNVLGSDERLISATQADNVLLHGKGDEDTWHIDLLCYAGNGVWLGWLADEEQWRLAEIFILGLTSFDGREYDGPTQTPLRAITMAAPEFADQELLEMLMEVEELRSTQLGMGLNECREAIGPESSGFESDVFSDGLSMLHYDVWEDGELRLTFTHNVCGSMVLRLSQDRRLEPPTPGDEPSE